MIPQDTLYRYTADTAVIELLESQKLSFRDPENWDDKNDSRLFRKYEEKNQKKAFAICMTRSSETFHHWSVYSPKGERNNSMRISFNKQKIIEICESNKFEYKFIEYIKLEDLHDHQNKTDLQKLFLKRYAYRDEEEFRIISVSENGSAPEIRIDPPSTIQKITFSPWMDKKRKIHYQQKIKNICQSIIISETSLIDNKTWRDFADGKSLPTQVR